MRKDTRLWIKKAEDDLKVAKLIKDEIPEYSLFHSQQAVEKLLKAFLIEKNVYDPRTHRTHNLNFLVDECIKIDKDFKSLLDLDLIIFAKAIEVRYPTDYTVSEDEATEAIKVAEKVKEFIKKKLRKI